MLPSRAHCCSPVESGRDLKEAFTRLGRPCLRCQSYRSNFPASRLGCGRLRCHSLISCRNSLFLVSFVSVASCRSSSAIRPEAKSGRPTFFGFSNRIVMAPRSTVSHDDAGVGGDVIHVFGENQSIGTCSRNSFVAVLHLINIPQTEAARIGSVTRPLTPDGSFSVAPCSEGADEPRILRT